MFCCSVFLTDNIDAAPFCALASNVELTPRTNKQSKVTCK